MKQSRRIMFVHSSQPLVEAPVRLACSDGMTEHELVTDGDGQVFCELEEGAHTAKIFNQKTWLECMFQVTGKQSLFVVDINTNATGSFAHITGSFGGLRNQVLGDRYVFEEVIGRGGMGVVVRASDKLLNRIVAIKMLNDEFLDNKEAQQIFLEEARSIATLTHPNLVGIYDVTMLEGRAMIVFEHIQGEDLDSIFAEYGKISEAGVLRIAIQLTRALKYLHSQGILHRDIKPSNVLMQPDGMLKIIDFGLARPLEQLALKGTRVRGTPAYMAPEQIEGSQLIAATDIYQLGVSLYELLTGQLPFSSGNMAYSHVHLDPPRIEELLELHEPRLANLIHACLFKLPEDRPSAEVLFKSFQSLYASNTVFYDQFPGVIVANTDALFSETVELSIPDFRPSTQRTKAATPEPTLDHLPGTSTTGAHRFITGSHAMMDSPHFEEEEASGGQRLLIIAVGLVLLLFGLGSVILMLLNEPDKTMAALDTGSSEVSSREDRAPSALDVVLPPASDDAPEVKDSLETPPVVEVILDEDEGVPAVVVEVEDVSKAVDPKTVTRSTKPVVSKATATVKKDDPSEPASSRDEPEEDVRKESPPLVNEDVVATTPAPAEKEVPSSKDDEPEETSEAPTTKRVIRKKIIRKVVRKKSTPSGKEDEDTQRAPVSF